MIGKKISGLPYSYESQVLDRIIISGKVIDKVKVPFKHELEVVLVDAYLISTIEGYTVVMLPMDVQSVCNYH